MTSDEHHSLLRAFAYKARNNRRIINVGEILLLVFLVLFGINGPKGSFYLSIGLFGIWLSLMYLLETILDLLSYQEKRFFNEMVDSIDAADNKEEWERYRYMNRKNTDDE